MPQNRSSLRSNLLLAAASLLFAFLLAEAGLRLHAHLVNRGLLSEALATPVEPPKSGRLELGHMIRLSRNPKIIYELKPDLAGTFKRAPTSTNAAGFRGPHHPQAKPPGVVRIVGLGDSFMFGHGVGDDDVYLTRLEELLNRHSAAPRFEIVNTAVPGYNTVMEVETLKSRGLAYQPDLVLIHFVGNDLDLPNFIRVKAPVLSLRRSFVADLVATALERPRLREALERHGLQRAPIDDEARRFVGDPDEVPAEYRSLVGWESYEAAMGELAELGRKHGFEVALVTFSTTFTPLHRRVLGLGRELGFATFDVGTVFRDWLDAHGESDYRTSALAVSPDNMHPSALGHRVAARALFRFLCAGPLAGRLEGCDLAPWDPPVPGPAVGG